MKEPEQWRQALKLVGQVLWENRNSDGKYYNLWFKFYDRTGTVTESIKTCGSSFMREPEQCRKALKLVGRVLWENRNSDSKY
jgi:hypothetical protein